MNIVIRSLLVAVIGIVASGPGGHHRGPVATVPVALQRDLVHDQDDLDEMKDMELMERVAELQLKLSAAQISERDDAEKALEKLGPRILDYLDPADDASSDSRERLQRVRGKLEKRAAELAAKPTHVTLNGSLSITKALASIAKQTGNNVHLPENLPDEYGDRKLNLSLDNVNFWTAIKVICQKAEFEIDTYGSPRGQLVLVPKRPQVDRQGNPTNIQADPLPSDQPSLFNIEVIRVDASRNLAQPSLDHCRLLIRVRWEPRVQPISIEIPMSELKIIDEFDNVIEVANPEATIPGVVQPEIPELEFSIPLPLVDRQIENIKTLTAKINTVLPGRVETFTFKNVSQLKPGAQQRKAGAIVTYGGTEKNDDIYGVTIKLGFEETSRAFESHQGWVFENQAVLIDKDGNQIDNIGSETISQSENEVGVQFYFAENPLEYTIVYKTPAAIVQLPVTIKLKKIPLP